MTGVLLIDKPSGPTSHDVVAFARRLLGTSRVGHTGTLDPLATGLLVLLVGPATRLSRFLVTDEKEYLADVRLGMATPTYDAASLSDVRDPASEVRGPRSDVTSERIRAILPDFRGTFLQTPPAFSAKKVAGYRAYDSARKGKPVNLAPVEVSVRELELLSFEPPHLAPRTSDLGPRTSDAGPLLRLRVTASAGFYVRSLAHDLGQALGCGAHLEGLRRIRAGRFRIEDAARLDDLQADPAPAARLIPVNVLLSDLPAVTLTPEGLRRAANGNPLAPAHLDTTADRLGSEGAGSTAVFRVLGGDGEVLAVAERRPDGLLHPLVVLR